MPDIQEQSGEGDIFSMKKNLLRTQWPERRLQRKNGVSEDPKISADSTVGKNKRVWEPEDALDQAKFPFAVISEFISLSLWLRNEVLEHEVLEQTWLF